MRPFGSVGIDELTQKKCKSDPEMEALVLFDLGKTYFTPSDEGFHVVYERHTRIKIFTTAGFEYAEIEIPFYQKMSEFEKVMNLEGSSYNLINGEIVKTSLDPSQIYTQKTSDNWYIRKTAIPEIKEGSVIEYRYKIVSPLLFNLRGWQFQRKIPTFYSELTFASIPFYEYTYVMQNASKFDFYESFTEKDWEKHYGSVTYNDIITRFGMKDIPAFKDVSFITTEQDYIMRLDFQLSKVTTTQGVSIPIAETWDKIASDLNSHKDFGKFISAATRYSKDFIEKKGIGRLNEAEKFSAVVDFVKSRLKWNEECRIFATKKVNTLLEEDTGNSSEINLFLTGMLNASGIEAYPILVSTRDHGRLRVDYPFLQFFNYIAVLAKVNDKWILSDATEPNCPQQHLPTRCLNGKGLVIKEKTWEFVSLEEKEPSLLQKDFLIQFTPETDSMIIDLTIKSTIYESMRLKSAYSDDMQEFEEDLRSKGYDPFSKIQTSGYDNSESPYIINCQITSIPESIEGAIYIAPFLSEPVTENPFEKSVRNYPINITYPKCRIYKSTIVIPQGFHIEKLPASTHMEKVGVEFSYSAISDGQTVEINASYALKLTEFRASELMTLKFLYIDLIKKLNEKVVLTKTR
ncbi:MAG: DUF3857 domain-containing protein [Bacteroidales bacterium]|nr:DUF3857 domain-containing protein [Bacteroidales bacterium]